MHVLYFDKESAHISKIGMHTPTGTTRRYMDVLIVPLFCHGEASRACLDW